LVDTVEVIAGLVAVDFNDDLQERSPLCARDQEAETK
jgi:hypothetical protein